MNDRLLADDGIPVARIAVDVVEVADGNIEPVIEPGFISRGAGMVDAVLRYVDAFDRAAHPRQGPQRAAEAAGDIEHPLTGMYPGLVDQVLSHGRGGFRHGFPAGHVAADVDVGAAPACFVKPGHRRVIVIRSGLFAVEYSL